MAAETSNKPVSSTDSGFPDYLNFDNLRSEAIAYLGNLSGKLWTDYNVHDPGITILEVLIYALLDLGYRTNLPPLDLFTRPPDDTSKDNNFFTPAQILVNNPLTITDYRKLLVDIKGVKNAWLEVDENTSVNFCSLPNETAHIDAARNNQICRNNLLNGLYHVYIQTERAYDLHIPEEKQAYDELIAKIKCALMAHRNLCEDFADIKVLCTLKIGLCADIELEPEANGEEIYLKIVQTLQHFFSPTPRFYTLQQLLEKQKSIEEIFAGRPFNVTESHGFVDTEEFEQIELRKKIHLSDVYHALFDIEGVKNVRNLSWKACSDTNQIADLSAWELHLPQNHIPEFSVSCSGFQFYKFGMKLGVDIKKYDAYLQMAPSSNGKVLYKQPSPYLDHAIPQGVYRKDLAEYYSIQNEFPSVYGIREGELKTDVSDARKAQALQLQGFLLFFDQLLANYLSQLKNIRSLFAFSSPATAAAKHTYFINQLTNVPQIQKLLRYKTDANGTGSLGNTGGILAYPTDRTHFEWLIETGQLKNTDLERNCNEANIPDFPESKFCFGAVRDQAVNQLKEDLLYGNYEPVIASNNDDCYFFYIFTSSPDFVLISKHYYKNEKEALNAAVSVKYTATFSENFRTFIATDCESGQEYFYFDIELNLDAYAGYLQLIVEDEILYRARREQFLNHLLSRFAETFTDFALLNANLPIDELQKKQINAKEFFLTNYDDLSSNRGKAYDYLCNGWKNDNVSGIEKRFKALAGIENPEKHALCNFVVEKAEGLYQPEIELGDQKFTLESDLNKPAAVASVKSVYDKLNSDPLFALHFADHDNAWEIIIKDDFNNKYTYSETYKTKEEAGMQQEFLSTLFSRDPNKAQNVYVSRYIFKIQLLDHAGIQIAEYIGGDKAALAELSTAEDKLQVLAADINVNLNNPALFKWDKEDHIEIGNLILVNAKNPGLVFLNEKALEYYSIEEVNLREDLKFKFKFRDINKKILFESTEKFDTETLARERFEKLLPSLTNSQEYAVKKNEPENTFRIVIKSGEEDLAVYFEFYSTETEAYNKINQLIAELELYTYTLSVSQPVPDQWKFKFLLTGLFAKSMEFDSVASFKDHNAAFETAKKFYSDIANIKLKTSKGDLLLESKTAKSTCIWNEKAENDEDRNVRKNEAGALLRFHKDLLNETSDVTDEKLEEKLFNWQTNPNENYKFRLVDKDNPLAIHTSFAKIKGLKDARQIRDFLIQQVYEFIDFNTGGNDIVCCYEDEKTKRRWFHYQIKCTNRFYKKGNAAGKELVLFESTNGYASRDEALNAFTANFYIILRKASVATNYADNGFISLREFIIHDDAYNTTGSEVFIPKQTMEELGGYEVQQIIIPMIKSYPIKYIAEKRFRFVLFNQQQNHHDWRSVSIYETAGEAMEQLQFFLQLLKYPGNYHIENNKRDCRFYIYIREVLAESLRGFATCEDAWGADGVEKFVCISQTREGFHTYFNRKHCSNSFFVACGNTGLVHPCRYETPKRRDNALKTLYQAASFDFFELFKLDNNDVLLLDLNNEVIAKILITHTDNNEGNCDQLIDFFEAIYIDANYISPKDDNPFFLANSSGVKIAEPAMTGIQIEEWKKRLKTVACYFPVLRNELTRSGKQKCNYRVQIKLPGFDSCQEDLEKNDCSHAEKYPACKSTCYVAWQTECCFDYCCDALLFYFNALNLLKNYDNYKRVYACNCGDYGIELHPETIGIERRSAFDSSHRNDIRQWICGRSVGIDRTLNNNNWLQTNDCSNEIIAINPQQYTSEAMACTAVERAKKLINSEGLHLVEHILLRPRCKNADGVYEECSCSALPKPCIDPNNPCHFEWIPGGDPDPCEKDKKICFTPGYDPFSFIATLALPAWPSRFRSNENRVVIEKLLQKEAPAHVLLRILWLNPRDLCCFEYYFKTWNEWLAKNLCIDYDNCDFLRFLFNKHFDVLAPCDACIPCSCDVDTPVSCFENEPEACKDFNLLDQINDLFCFIPDADFYDFDRCESCNEVHDRLAQPAFDEIREPQNNPGADVVALEHEKAIRIQARFGAYKKNIKTIVDDNPSNPIAAQALRFLSATHPDEKRYADLINKILKNKSDQRTHTKALSFNQKQILIQNITWQYLDKVCLTHQPVSVLAKQEPLFSLLRKKRIDMHALFDGWNSTEIKNLAPETNINEIRNYLTV